MNHLFLLINLYITLLGILFDATEEQDNIDQLGIISFAKKEEGLFVARNITFKDAIQKVANKSMTITIKNGSTFDELYDVYARLFDDSYTLSIDKKRH